jgi:hypothetical protein
VATLTDLARRLNAYADNLDDVLYDRIARTALAVVRALVSSTPADTSKALSNWRVGQGAAGAIAPYFPGEGGSTRGSSGDAAIAAAEEAIKAARGANKLVIFNSVPYIRRLNEGSSLQAPAGFIEAALLQGRLEAKAAKQ